MPKEMTREIPMTMIMITKKIIKTMRQICFRMRQKDIFTIGHVVLTCLLLCQFLNRKRPSTRHCRAAPSRAKSSKNQACNRQTDRQTDRHTQTVRAQTIELKTRPQPQVDPSRQKNEGVYCGYTVLKNRASSENNFIQLLETWQLQ